mgnify:CR=1 FL=1
MSIDNDLNPYKIIIIIIIFLHINIYITGLFNKFQIKAKMGCFKPLRRISNYYFSIEMIAPVILQPMLIGLITNLMPNDVKYIALYLSIVLAIIIKIPADNLSPYFLHYWTVTSITYIIIVFEFTIVPLAEILPEENFFLVLFTVLSLFFLNLTVINKSKSVKGDDVEKLNVYSNGNGVGSMCQTCKIKLEFKNYHCGICKECIFNYNHHCYWLNCCIGESNYHYYFAGIFFGVFAMSYASLLILTTICSPDYYFGILLPENCTDVCGAIE